MEPGRHHLEAWSIARLEELAPPPSGSASGRSGRTPGSRRRDRYSVVRAAVAWFMMMAKRGEEERRKIAGPDVPVPLRYDTPHNSRSLLLCGTPGTADT